MLIDLGKRIGLRSKSNKDFESDFQLSESEVADILDQNKV